MTIHLVSEGEIDRCFEAPFNPPMLGKGEDDLFADEYWHVHKKVTECLAAFGREDNYGNGDFTMNQDYGLSRNISVELSSKCLWTPQVIESMQQTLIELEPEYRIFVSHSLLKLPDLYLFVEKTRAIGFCEDLQLLKKFGNVQK